MGADAAGLRGEFEGVECSTGEADRINGVSAAGREAAGMLRGEDEGPIGFFGSVRATFVRFQSQVNTNEEVWGTADAEPTRVRYNLCSWKRT